MDGQKPGSLRGMTRRGFIAGIPAALGAMSATHNVLAQSQEASGKDTAEPTFVVGIQTHAHDFLYEGTNNVIETARDRAGANAVLTCATYVRENMRLTHNPSFERYRTQGGFYYDFDPTLFADSTIKPVRSPEEKVGQFDAIKAVSEACREQDIAFYAWVSSFNYPQEGPGHPGHQVVSAGGKKHPGWLCPNSPDAREFSLRVYEDLVRHYDIDGVFVDRFRFPDDITTCFCDHCIREMRKRGLEPDRLRRAILSLAGQSSMVERQAFATLGMSIDPVFYIPGLPEIAELVRFKMDAITSYVKSLYERVKTANPEAEVGLDLFSPSVAWTVGQQPDALVRHCDWIKPMLYHLGDGYHAIRGVIALSEAGMGTTQEIYEKLKHTLAAKGMDLPATFEEFRQTSFPTSWIKIEQELTRTLTGAQKPLYAGLQLWRPTTPDTVGDAIRAAVRAKSDGVFLYCYGWSTLDNLDAAGRTLRSLGLA